MAFIDTVATTEANIPKPPASVKVVSDSGQDGQRGGYFFYCDEKPTALNTSSPPQPLDWAINLDPVHEEYLYFYQYASQGAEVSWGTIFKTVPDKISFKTNEKFVNGAVTITKDVPKKSFPFEQKFGIDKVLDINSINVQLDIEGVNFDGVTRENIRYFSIAPPSYNASTQKYTFEFSIVAKELVESTPNVYAFQNISGQRNVNITIGVV